MCKGQKTALIITLIILLPLTISLFIIKVTGSLSLFLYFKAALSVGFVFYSLITIYIRKTFDKLSLFSLFALILGMLGDIFLGIANKIEGIGYTAGVLMFLLQHIMVCAGLLTNSGNKGNRKKLFISLPITAVGVCLFVFLLIKVVGVILGAFTIPVTVYGVILAWTAVIPFVLRDKKDSRLLLLSIAGILFFIADSLLICGFIENSPRALSSSNLITYYYAQYLIAFSTGMKIQYDDNKKSFTKDD